MTSKKPQQAAELTNALVIALAGGAPVASAKDVAQAKARAVQLERAAERAKAKPKSKGGRGIKVDYTKAQIKVVCELILSGKSEHAVLIELGYSWRSFQKFKKDHKWADEAVVEAEEALISHEMSMGRAIEIVDEAWDAGSAAAAKVKLWGRIAMAEKIRPERFGTKHVKVDASVVHDFEGELLAARRRAMQGKGLVK